MLEIANAKQDGIKNKTQTNLQIQQMILRIVHLVIIAVIHVLGLETEIATLVRMMIIEEATQVVILMNFLLNILQLMMNLIILRLVF